MPYSDNPPAHVVPESRQGREYYNRYIAYEGLDGFMSVALCNEYKDSGRGNYETIDDTRPHAIEVNACKNRRSEGERDKNWCYRCVAGLPYVALHIYDAERGRDRSIDIR